MKSGQILRTLDGLLHSNWFSVLLVLGDLVLGLLIVNVIPYTEIDWIAYMQEVEGVLGGEYDYTKLRGDTGPLVYPAGFVYVFILLRWLTDSGKNILRAQYIFAVLHSVTVALILGCFSVVRKEKRNKHSIPFWVCILLVISRRVHSIFALRLFNDCVAMVLVYAAALLFVKRKWFSGVIIYSFAASIKMNVILFAPGLAVFLIQANGFLLSAAYGCVFGAIQILLALPFLLENPSGYVGRAVDVGRVFMYKWTVNYKFLSEEAFQSKELALILAISVLLAWLFFGQYKWSKSEGGLLHLVLGNFWKGRNMSTVGDFADHILQCFFASNFIGVVFFRSLHYQFYSW